MPYIKDRRPEMDRIVKKIGRNLDILGDKITNKKLIKEIAEDMINIGVEVNGDLNYILYALCKRYVKPSYNNYKNYITKFTYNNFNVVPIGDLQEVLHGFYFNYVYNHKGFENSRNNNFVGELDCCAREIYRRLIAPYEEKKCSENGDV